MQVSSPEAVDEPRTLSNLLIVGAPKCGTTSLARWLSDHPQVYMSPVKEPDYFSHDFNLRHTPEEDEYVRLFEEAGDAHQVIGEASTHCLFSNVAAPEIESTVPDLRYVVMVRNPTETYAAGGEIRRSRFNLHGVLSSRIQREMADYYEEDVHRLDELLGRDLMHWLES